MLNPMQLGQPIRFGSLNENQKKLAEALGADPSKINNTDELRQTFLKRLDESADTYQPSRKGKKADPKDESNPIKAVFGAIAEALADVLEPAAHVIYQVFIPIANKFGKLDFKKGDELTEEKNAIMEDFVRNDVREMLGYPDSESLEKALEGPMTKAYNKLEQARKEDQKQP